ncbi:MAG: hypothetical protein ABIJ97_02675 [Bacteroidota bacterium]
MKKIAFLIIILIQMQVVFSQSEDTEEEYPFWVSVTSKGGFVNSHLFNNNIDEDSRVDFGYFEPGYTVGGQIGANWGGGFGFAIELMHTRLNQHYSIDLSGIEYDKNISINLFDKFLLIKSVGLKGSYIELGGKFTRVTKAIEKNNISTPFLLKTSDFSNKERVGMVFGFGVNVLFTEVYSINIGMRAAYTLSNFMDDEKYPIRDGLHPVDYSSYSTTNPVTIDFVLNLSFHIGELEVEKKKK